MLDRHFVVVVVVAVAFSPLLLTGIRHLSHVLTVPPTKACLLYATPAGLDLYIQVHARRLLPSAVPWISEDRLFPGAMNGVGKEFSRFRGGISVKMMERARKCETGE